MKWNIIDVDGKAAEEKYGISGLTAKIITAGGLSEEQNQELLNPNLHLSTSKAPCVLACCKRLLQAKKDGEKVFVGGDYDADGICSTAIMKATLDRLGIENGYYIPNRFKEGYGLRKETLELAVQKGYTLIVTVDNGVKAHEAIQKANELGIDIIVTDHHEIEEDVNSTILVHPDFMEKPFQYLSGAGVALEISRNLIGDDPDLTALAAVAAIGDVMPLWQETRTIVLNGLAILKTGNPKPLAVLLRPGTAVDETAVAFQIVPKLNAVGRMNDISNVNTLVPYLLSKNDQVIAHYALQLNAVNEARKELSNTEMAIAEKHVSERPFEIIYEESFHEGICGLVAGRIASQYHKPVLVFAKSNNLIKGSGRSVPGFNMFEFFSTFENLVAFGGHAQAVGISIAREEFANFSQQVTDKMSATGWTYEEPVTMAIRIDMSDITFENISSLTRLSPYPKELIPPYFALEDFTVTSFKETPKVAKYTLKSRTGNVEAVLYKRKNLPVIEKPVRLIGRLSINRFRGSVTLQMEIEDIA